MKKSMNEEKSTGGLWGEALKELAYFLTILFTALRACGVISWSWFWVMSPIFFSWGLAIICLIIIGLVAAVALKEENEND